ncbi:MAG: hypothetical protein MJ109_00195 [Kiritimatiellae bacterium]|nr:hypothetical protein [Kiritimatiellia bacterium]
MNYNDNKVSMSSIVDVLRTIFLTNHFASRASINKLFEGCNYDLLDAAFECLCDSLEINLVDAGRAKIAHIRNDVYYLKPWCDKRKDELGVTSAEAVIIFTLLDEVRYGTRSTIEIRLCEAMHHGIIIDCDKFFNFAKGLYRRHLANMIGNINNQGESAKFVQAVRYLTGK